MSPFLTPARRPLALISALLLTVSATALAGGGLNSAALRAEDEVIGRASYRCKGGIQVQVTQMPNTARVEFAGRSQLLRLAPAGSTAAYQNTDFAWFSEGTSSYMKNTRSGGLTLTDCVAQSN